LDEVGVREVFMKLKWLLVPILLSLLGCAAKAPRGIDVSYVQGIPPFYEPPVTSGTPGNSEIYGEPDEDGDGIRDDVEGKLRKLVEKFCPTLVLDISDTGGVLSRPLYPMPVETFAVKLTVDRFSIAPFEWKGREMIDLREIDDAKLEKLSRYFLRRAEIKPGEEVEIAFFDFPGDTPKEWLWALNVIQWMEGYKPTVYAHPFILVEEGKKLVVIQYWYLFPFDGWGEVHEGDWEHVNVVVTDIDPQNARLVEVQFYFHGYVARLREVELEGGTHPVVYVGGGANGSHGMFPYAGKWLGVDGGGGAERVRGGLKVRPSDFDIRLIPDPEAVKLEKLSPKERGKLIWLKLNARWGRPWTGRPGRAKVSLKADWDGYAPFGPPFSPAWNRSGELLGYEEYRPREKGWLELLPTTDIIERLITGRPVFESSK